MNNGAQLLAQASLIQYRISLNDKKPRPFGTSQLLYQSEIHLIDAIGTGEGLNASQLSQKLGVTNGAVTQLVDRLIRKRLVEKYKKTGNKKEVYLRLTDEGEIAFENHRRFHKELNDKMIDYLDALNKEQAAVIFGLMDVIERYLPDLSKEDKQ